MKWNLLSSDAYMRLCECRSKKSDIESIARCYMTEESMTPEVALEITLEHLGANNQFFDLTNKDYDRIIKNMKGA